MKNNQLETEFQARMNLVNSIDTQDGQERELRLQVTTVIAGIEWEIKDFVSKILNDDDFNKEEKHLTEVSMGKNLNDLMLLAVSIMTWKIEVTSNDLKGFIKQREDLIELFDIIN